MTFLLKHKDRYPGPLIKLILKIFAVLVVSFILLEFGGVGNLASRLSLPAVSLGDGFYKFTHKLPNWFITRNSLIEKIDLLEYELENARLLALDSTAIGYENKKLREDFAINIDEEFVRAKVIARPPQIPFDSVMINSGENDGLEVGDLVVVQSRLLVGFISKVEANTATVSLSSSNGNSFHGLVERTHEALEIIGVSGNNFASRTLSDSDIKEGDRIIISGDSDLLLAIVGSVENYEPISTKNIIMTLPFNINTLYSVFVLK